MRPSTSSLLAAEFRRGLKDAQNAVLNPWNGVTAQHEEPGTIGNPTPQMVTQSIQGERSFDDVMASHAGRSPQKQMEPER